jgi:hypothetical protein
MTCPTCKTADIDALDYGTSGLYTFNIETTFKGELKFISSDV